MKKFFIIIGCIILATQSTLTFASCNLRHQATVLYKTLLPFHQTITTESSKHTQHQLQALLEKPRLIHKICGPDKNCNNSVFSFTNESHGLIDALTIEKPVIKACNGDIDCIKKNGDYEIYRMLESDSDYLKGYLKRYLSL